MYVNLVNDLLYKSDLYIKEPENLPIELDFIGGDYIAMPVETPLVYRTNGKSGDVMRDFLKGSFPIMSEKFVSILQEAGVNNLQLFPAIIKSEVDGTVWENYFGVNILGLISCADFQKSEYAEIMPGHFKFRELAIHLDKTKDALLFRLQEDSTTIIMHKSVGRHIKSQDPNKTLKGWSVGRIIQ